MNIVYSSSDYYFKPTLVSIYSLLKNSVENHKIILLSSGISRENQLKFENLVTSMHSEPSVIEIEKILETKALKMNLPIMRGNYSTYARLFLSEILDLDSVLLIDSDTLVVGDISNIMNEINEDGIMFASRDFVISNKYSNHEDKDLSEKKYFNMGILYTNLSNWRKNDISSIFKNNFNCNHKLKIADQTIVNKYLHSFVTEISVRFNWYTYFHYNFDYCFYKSQNNKTNFIEENEFNESKVNKIIIHYIGTWFERPWYKFNIINNNDLYLNYWNELFEASDLFDAPSISFKSFYDFLSIIVFKVFGMKAYYNFRYIFIQKLKKIL